MNSIFKKMNKYENLGKIQQHYKNKNIFFKTKWQKYSFCLNVVYLFCICFLFFVNLENIDFLNIVFKICVWKKTKNMFVWCSWYCLICVYSLSFVFLSFFSRILFKLYFTLKTNVFWKKWLNKLNKYIFDWLIFEYTS
jgi:hypothetical protein